MALVPGSRVTSARNGSPSTVPSWSDWVTWAMGSSGLVISVGRAKAGVARSTRWLSGASGRQPLPFSCLTQVASAWRPMVGAAGLPASPPDPQARGGEDQGEADPEPGGGPASGHRASASPGLSSSASWPTTLKLRSRLTSTWRPSGRRISTP